MKLPMNASALLIASFAFLVSWQASAAEEMTDIEDISGDLARISCLEAGQENRGEIIGGQRTDMKNRLPFAVLSPEAEGQPLLKMQSRIVLAPRFASRL